MKIADQIRLIEDYEYSYTAVKYITSIKLSRKHFVEIHTFVDPKIEFFVGMFMDSTREPIILTVTYKVGVFQHVTYQRKTLSITYIAI
jgi:hypothetical protein